MASDVDICNLALSHIGCKKIQSIAAGSSKEARHCEILFDAARDAALEAFDWGFARKFLVLALLPDTYTGWAYAYGYPSDCLAPRKILDDTGAYTGTSYDIDRNVYEQIGTVEFDVMVRADLMSRVIVTNKETAELAYTAKVTTTPLFSPLFVKAMSYELAAELAQPIKASKTLREQMKQEFYNVISQAQASDANVGYKKPTADSSFVKARS